ncbi:urea carboxylase-associated family protein [Aquamicrobium terrae]|uniref:Uncharacterized protein YcgI (DUF1989 family) n=1 Tax=Aquamicrobium terrae TaxID=1324945 RepID=A0ABV2N2B9_9HYPH
MKDMSEIVIDLPARRGTAIALREGQTIRIVNIHGSQVLDCWAFNRDDPFCCMSMEHTRSYNSRIVPRVGDILVDNRYKPMFEIVADTSPGVHDTLMCSCSAGIYERMGHPGHDNCEDNLHRALAEVEISIGFTPSPFNIFMNYPFSADGEITREPPVSKPGDHVDWKCLISEALVIISCCPQDLTPINGISMAPQGARCFIINQ